jgi:quinol monooxygenase YgiN
MYGTIARLYAKPDMLDTLREVMERTERVPIDGAVFVYVYHLDNEPNVLMMAVGFESKEKYVANAQSPDQHTRFMEMMSYLEREPEWYDGEIVMAAT